MLEIMPTMLVTAQEAERLPKSSRRSRLDIRWSQTRRSARFCSRWCGCCAIAVSFMNRLSCRVGHRRVVRGSRGTTRRRKAICGRKRRASVHFHLVTPSPFLFAEFAGDALLGSTGFAGDLLLLLRSSVFIRSSTGGKGWCSNPPGWSWYQ